MNELAVYVVHAPVGYEIHGERVKKLLGELQMNFEFVNESSLSDIPSKLDQMFNTNFIKESRKGVLFCTLSHIMCYEKIVENNDKYALILEDDPYFLGDFKTKLGKVINEAATLSPKYMISLENSTLEFPKNKEIRKGKYIYPAKAGRCAGAYLIDFEGARSILNNLKTKKCDEVIDWWHNTLVKDQVINMYWAHPPFVEQCSLNGKSNAGISSRSSSLKRRIAWFLQKYYKTYFLRFFK